MTTNQKFTKKFSNSITHNIKLSNYSWFNLGGPAEYLFKPKNKEENNSKSIKTSHGNTKKKKQTNQEKQRTAKNKATTNPAKLRKSKETHRTHNKQSRNNKEKTKTNTTTHPVQL